MSWSPRERAFAQSVHGFRVSLVFFREKLIHGLDGLLVLFRRSDRADALEVSNAAGVEFQVFGSFGVGDEGAPAATEPFDRDLAAVGAILAQGVDRRGG